MMNGYFNGSMMNGFYHGTFHWWAMTIGWLILVVFLVVLIWVLVRTSGRPGKLNSGSERSALDILKERYAKGEINTEEFRERKKEIQP